MKKEYLVPALRLIEIALEDVIATSLTIGGKEPENGEKYDEFVGL